MYINTHLSAKIGMKITHVTGIDRVSTSHYQFLLVQKGAIRLEFDQSNEKYILHKDDIILIPPDLSFSCGPINDNTILGVRIDAPYINSIIDSGYILECNSTHGRKKDYMQLNKLMVKIFSLVFSDNNEILMAAAIYELTDCLKKNFIHKKEDIELTDIELRNQERITWMTNFIQMHYHQPLPLSSLADKMFLTPQYISKFFKKYFGTTFSKYLNSIRLQHAHIELIETDNSITNIALNNGFSTIAAFNKAFRDMYSVSPTTYRNKNKRQDHFMPGEEEYEFYESISNPSLNTIQTTAENPTAYNMPWQDTLNIGILSDAIKISFQNSFLEYRKKIPVKYVRFCNVFSEDIMYFDFKTQQFNFGNFNDIFDFFHEVNVLPFIELSFKPQKNEVILSSTDKKKMFENEKDISYYYDALKAMIKHCIIRYGLKYVSDWRFEVWAKHEEMLVYSESASAYVKKYMEFYNIVKELIPTCQIGGPGFNICGDFNVFCSLLNTFESKNIPFDFISLYAFSYEKQVYETDSEQVNHAILSPNPDHIYNTFQRYRNHLENSIYSKTPIYITEFGSILTFHSYLTDSVFQAAFLCRNMLSFIHDCKCIAYFRFFDNTSIFTKTDNFYPSAGLVSYNGIPKPSYHAYTFLFRLGRNLISQGDHYIMTSNTVNQYQLLFYNYEHYSKGFCFNSIDPIRVENTYEILESCDPLQLHFICRDIPSGRYKVTKYSLNRNYGSALDKYLRILDTGNTTSRELLTTILNFREDEVNYYKQTSIPRQDIYYIKCEASFDLTLELESHEIIFYELTRIL